MKLAIKFLGLLILVSACTRDTEVSKMQYMPDMADGPGIKTHREYLDPPEESVPLHATIYPAALEDADSLQNPLARSEASVANGKKMWDTYCVVCHGPAGKGDGSLGDLFPRPPDITGEIYKSKKDGFFFYKITFGSALMPAYGHSISIQERWQIVQYLRQLQGEG